MYKDLKSLEERKREFESIHSLHPNKIPVVLEEIDTSNTYKFVLDRSKHIGNISQIIRKKKNSITSYFFFINENKCCNGSNTVGDLYDKYHDKHDKFLYINFTEENTFGLFSIA